MIPLRIHSTTKSSKSRLFKWAIIVLLCVVIGGVLFLKLWPPFGGTMSGERLKRAQASPHYRDGKFTNTLPQPAFKFGEVWGYLKEQFFGGQVRNPPKAIPVTWVSEASGIAPEAMNALGQTEPPPGLRAVWLGHSSVYIELDGLRLLVDPVFSLRASPFNVIGPKRFHAPPVSLEDLPKIDAVMISHDHPDHLDMRTVKFLSSRGSHFFVPLGVGSHLDQWEIPESQITELDWFESAETGGLTIICTPAQHYSGRRIIDYNKTLWSSWSVVGPQHRVFYSGDTGFSDHFQQIGDQLGPFDLSIIKIGLYGPGASWIFSHIDPEDAVKAHLAVGARRMLPVHWGTFNIALHDWDEPIKRAVKAAKEKNVDLVTPRVGEVVTAGEPFSSERWWEGVK
jgi:L-ascorbate metabolism protein UlaG (beta-lactamase superfamily)